MDRLRFLALHLMLLGSYFSKRKSIINRSVRRYVVESHDSSLCRLIGIGWLVWRGLLLALLGPTALVSTLAVVVVNNLAIVVIIIEGITIVNLWVVTAGDDLPGAQVGVNLSAWISLINFRSARRARGLVYRRFLGRDATAWGILAITKGHPALLNTARYGVASSSTSDYCTIGKVDTWNRGRRRDGLGDVELRRWWGVAGAGEFDGIVIDLKEWLQSPISIEVVEDIDYESTSSFLGRGFSSRRW